MQPVTNDIVHIVRIHCMWLSYSRVLRITVTPATGKHHTYCKMEHTSISFRILDEFLTETEAAITACSCCNSICQTHTQLHLLICRLTSWTKSATWTTNFCRHMQENDVDTSHTGCKWWYVSKKLPIKLIMCSFWLIRSTFVNCSTTRAWIWWSNDTRHQLISQK